MASLFLARPTIVFSCSTANTYRILFFCSQVLSTNKKKSAKGKRKFHTHCTACSCCHFFSSIQNLQHSTARVDFFFFSSFPPFFIYYSLYSSSLVRFFETRRENALEAPNRNLVLLMSLSRKGEGTKRAGKKRLFEPNLEAGVDGLGQPKFYGARPARKQRRWKGERRGGWGGSGPEAIRKHSEKPDAQCLAKAISPNEPADALLIRTRRIGGVMRLSSNWTSYEPNTF